MQKRKNLFPVFIIFLIVCIVVILGSRTWLFRAVFGFTQLLILPLEKHITLLGTSGSLSSQEKLREENTKLSLQMVKLQAIQQENNALKDQFQTTHPKSQDLLQARIIASPRFIPGISVAEHIILDKGTNDQVRVGQAVVFKDNLIGKIVKTSVFLSDVELITTHSSSYAARTLQTLALGVIKGKGGGHMVLENVLLSENLKDSDTVASFGDVEFPSVVIPSGLIIGRILSIDKKPSALFQTAQVQSLIDFSKLTVVFIVKD